MTRSNMHASPIKRPKRRLGTLAALLTLGALSACGNVHHIEVGSIPDDYRTRHPIVVSEAEQAIDIPVVSSESSLAHSQIGRVEDFAYRFQSSGADNIRMMLPYGSRNGVAAGRVYRDILRILSRSHIPNDRIVVESYHAQDAYGPTPIRLSFATLVAKTGPCGRWPADIGDTSENKNYENFGCATQQNLAAQIADPRDLLAPRGMGPVDAGRRATVIDKYRKGDTTASDRSRTESNYEW